MDKFVVNIKGEMKFFVI